MVATETALRYRGRTCVYTAGRRVSIIDTGGRCGRRASERCGRKSSRTSGHVGPDRKYARGTPIILYPHDRRNVPT